jgi:hypothetical protein
MSLPPTLRERVLADAAKTKPRKLLRTRTIFLAAAALIIAFASIHGRRANWADLPSAWVTLAELALTSLLVSFVAIARGPHLVGPTARSIRLGLAAPAIALSLYLAIASPGICPAPPDRFWTATAACDVSALLLGLPLVIVFLVAHRGAVVVSRRLVGAVAGVAAASWSHAVLHWGCPFTDVMHITIGHALPCVPLAIAGALLGDRLLRS